VFVDAKLKVSLMIKKPMETLAFFYINQI